MLHRIVRININIIAGFAVAAIASAATLTTLTPNEAQAAVNTIAPDAARCTPDGDLNLANTTACTAHRLKGFADANYGVNTIKTPVYKEITSTSTGAVWHPYVICFWTTASANYCSTNDNIFIGSAFMNLYNTRPKHIALIAHEWGHHLSTERGGTFVYLDKPAVPFETQADCIAGAYFKYSQDNGWSTTETAESLRAWFAASADDAAHGTGQQRGDAFWDGYSNGLIACTPYAASYYTLI